MATDRKRRIKPYVGDMLQFHNELIEKGVFSHQEISRAIENSSYPYYRSRISFSDLFNLPFDNYRRTLQNWTPNDDLRLVIFLYSPRTISFIAHMFKCAVIVIECRLHILFGTRKWADIYSLSKERKEFVLNSVIIEYEMYKEANRIVELIEEFERLDESVLKNHNYGS